MPGRRNDYAPGTAITRRTRQLLCLPWSYINAIIEPGAGDYWYLCVEFGCLCFRRKLCIWLAIRAGNLTSSSLRLSLSRTLSYLMYRVNVYLSLFQYFQLLPAAGILLLRDHIPESPKWLIRNNRYVQFAGSL